MWQKFNRLALLEQVCVENAADVAVTSYLLRDFLALSAAA